MEELELIGLKLVQDLQLMSERVNIQQEKVEELTKSLASSITEVGNLKAELATTKEQLATSRAQLAIRSEATQHLEKDNANLRDSVAKFKVQVESSNVAKQQLMDKYQNCQSEMVLWREKYEEMEKTWSEKASLKTQAYFQQNQIKTLLQHTTSQLELLEKEQLKLDRSVQEVRSFNQSLVKNLQVQSTLLDRANKSNSALEKNLAEMTAKLVKGEREKEDLMKEATSNTGFQCENYAAEWEKYQQEMKKRIDGFIEQNEKLMEELNEARNLHEKTTASHPVATKGTSS